jgi:hypothetical protein
MASKERSPNYPSIGLGEAVTRLKLFYESEGKTSVDQEVAVKAMGYGGLSGASRTKLAALKQYGLLQGRADKIAITTLGLRVVHPDDEPDLADALREAARNPVIFSELLETHAEASDNAVVAFLVKSKGFTDDGARQLAKSFKDTLAVAKLDSGTNTPTGKGDNANAGKDKGVTGSAATYARTKSDSPPPPLSEGAVSFDVPYRGATLSVRVEVKGQPLGRAHVEKVVRYLELVAEDFPDVAPAAPQPASRTDLSGGPDPTDDDSGNRTNNDQSRRALGVSLPLMITKKMEAELQDAGYTVEQIRTMTPQQAHDNLKAAKN